MISDHCAGVKLTPVAMISGTAKCTRNSTGKIPCRRLWPSRSKTSEWSTPKSRPTRYWNGCTRQGKSLRKRCMSIQISKHQVNHSSTYWHTPINTRFQHILLTPTITHYRHSIMVSTSACFGTSGWQSAHHQQVLRLRRLHSQTNATLSIRTGNIIPNPILSTTNTRSFSPTPPAPNTSSATLTTCC